MSQFFDFPPLWLPPKPKASKATAFSLLSGIFTMIAGIAATALAWLYIAFVPPLLAPYWWAPIVIGIVLGLIIILGAFVIWQGSLGFGGAIVFLTSLLNIYLIAVWFIPVDPWRYAIIALGTLALIFGLIGGTLGVFGK
jgi:hypothetical protein